MQNDLVIFNSSTIIINSATSGTYGTEQRVVQGGKISERLAQLTNLLQRIILYWHHFTLIFNYEAQQLIYGLWT